MVMKEEPRYNSGVFVVMVSEKCQDNVSDVNASEKELRCKKDVQH